MPSPRERIAIVGGGPAGLTTGVLLHKHNIPFTIFDLREKPTDEELAKPSGMLDLHEESGIAALKECGLYDSFLALTGECSEDQKVADRDGNILYQDEGGMRDRPEISRHALTKLLIASLPTDHIKWGHKLVSASRSPSSSSSSSSPPSSSTTTAAGREIELDFGPYGRHAFDLVIGADGAWSKVRSSLLSPVRPSYAGIQSITLTIRHITAKYPHLANLVGKGSFSVLATRHGVMSQRGPQDSARLYVFLSTEDEGFGRSSGLVGGSAAAVKERVLGDGALLGGWGAVMKELVAVGCDEEVKDNPGAAVDLRPLYVLPVGHSWDHRAGVTVIGDAAHLMGPWAGEGVNLAMWDSLLLAQAIVKAQEAVDGKDSAEFLNALDPLMRDFEVDMVARAKEKAEESLSNGQMMFGEDGAKAFVDFFNSFGPPPE